MLIHLLKKLFSEFALSRSEWHGVPSCFRGPLTENFDSFPELFWHLKGSDCENIIIYLACRSGDVMTRLRLYSLLYAGLLDLSLSGKGSFFFANQGFTQPWEIPGAFQLILRSIPK